MRLPKFEYLAPKTINELCSVLVQHKGEVKILGGGTDLIVAMKQGLTAPRYVVNLKTVPGLDYIKAGKNGGMRIGALTALSTIEESSKVAEAFPMLAQAAGSVASPNIRSTATIGGNLCLDSRCSYYNQSKVWRASRGACLKQGGDVCHAVESLCEVACPIHMNVPEYIALIAKNRIEEALEVIRDTNPLAGVCGRVCHHPCESACTRGGLDEPMAIAALKRYAVDYGIAKGIQTSVSKAKPNGIKVAVVGSGPAGLTAAYHLCRWGYEVTVFEALAEPGGAMAWGIPEYRLPRNVLNADIEFITNLGVEIRTNSPVGKNGISFKSLRSQGYRAVFLDTGAGEGYELAIEGSKLENVYKGVDFLKKINAKEKVIVGKKTVVIGGGNVAVDVAKCALRLGADAVDLVCLESRETMPAIPEEIEEAEKLGVKLHCGWAPKQIVGSNGRVSGLRLVKCLSVFDGDWKFNPTYDEKTTTSLDAETIIIAAGQIPDLTFLEGSGIDIKDNRIAVDPITFATNKKGVFAGGDVVTGPGSIVDAMAGGVNAAISIHKYLQGKNLYEDRIMPSVKKVDLSRPGEEQGYPRQTMPTLAVEERLKSFKEVNLGFDQIMAEKEVARCLGCAVKECAAVFSADTVPALIALGGKVKIISAGAERTIFLENFYTGKGKQVNILDSGEFISEIQIPAVPPRTGGSYVKFSPRTVIDFPYLGVAALITLAERDVCTAARIVICGATSKPFRAAEAEKLLVGKKITEDAVEEAANEAANKSRIISTGGRPLSLNYRKKLMRGLVKKSVARAWKEAAAS